MPSKSFDTHKMRKIGRKEAEEIVPDGRKGMQSPGEIKNVKKKIHARARKMLQHEIVNPSATESFMLFHGLNFCQPLTIVEREKRFADEQNAPSSTPFLRASLDLQIQVKLLGLHLSG